MNIEILTALKNPDHHDPGNFHSSAWQIFMR